MQSGFFKAKVSILMLAGMSFSLFAAEFAPPAEGPVPFRRDKIPLDAFEMTEISNHLEELARGLEKESPASYRGAAQILALAMAVDPGNNSARELVARYQNDQLRTDKNQDRFQHARDKISTLLPWLDSEDAGSHGRALAACLKDILAISDPDKSFSGETNSLGSWAGWIPDISAYEPKVVTNQESTPTPETKKPAKTGIVLNEAQIQTILWKNIGDGNNQNWVMAPAPLQMSAHKMGLVENEDGEMVTPNFSIMIGSYDYDSSFSKLNHSLKNLLRQNHESLPAGYQLRITNRELLSSLQSGRRHSLSAAAAVLANSALTGTVPNAIVLGQIDETGAFKPSSDFWLQIKGLGKGNGQRLILPAEAATYLPSILAFENPDFFIQHEVLLASNFNQLLDLSAKSPPEPLAAQLTKFSKIRETAGTQDVRQFLTNRFVRQRLAEITKEAPYHYSAQMLLVQATGKRPTTIIRPILIAELTSAMQPMGWIADRSWEVTTSKIHKKESPIGIPFRGHDVAKFGAVYEQARKRIDEIERLATKEDVPLIESMRKVSVSLRSLDRTLRSRDAYSSYNESVVWANRKAAREFHDSYRAAMKQLASEAGNP